MKRGFSAWFIDRPVATTLITAAFVLIGLRCFPMLPVAPLPQTDIPTIRVVSDFPGADAETMASTVAVPLENAFAGISGITNMISSGTAGRATVTMQFDLNRNADVAAQEVQSAINNVSGQLPKDMPSLPKWQKVNPADMPILVLILKSDVLPLTVLSDLAENVITKQLSQIPGIADFPLIGQQRPAIAVKVDPERLTAVDLTLEDVRAALQKASVNLAKGTVYGAQSTTVLQINDQLFSPEEYADLIIAVKNGAPVYLKDIAEVTAGTENEYVRSFPEGRAGISIEINRQSGANIVEIADSVRARLPELNKMLPQTAELSVMNDRTHTIRSSLHEVKITFVITLILVLAVMALFLKNVSSTLIVAATLVVSMIFAAGAMYLLGFSINNLTLLALVIAIGFVVDDAIVVIENIYSHIERGEPPLTAAKEATEEISFTLVSITCSLIAAFIPLFFMPGIVGKLFYEFAATMTAAIVMSAWFALTLAPMLAARFVNVEKKRNKPDKLLDGYKKALRICLLHPRATLSVFAANLGIAVVGFVFIPKGFFPLQDIAFISGSTKAAEDVSFSEMIEKHKRLAEIVAAEPAVLTYTHAVGDKASGSLSNGKFWLVLKDRKDRALSAAELIDKLRPEFDAVAGIKMSLRAVQDINLGITQSSAQYLYTLKSSGADELYGAAESLTAAMAQNPLFKDVQSDLQLGTRVKKMTLDRKAAARYGITANDVDQTLFDAFGQRKAGEYQTAVNQYKVILKLNDDFAGKTSSLDALYLRSPITGTLVPLNAVVKNGRETRLKTELNILDTVLGAPQGAANEFARTLQNEIALIALSLAAIYIILGILYESFLTPVIIISTLSSAIIGALLFLSLWKMDFSVIAIIGCVMLFGLVLKNGILMVETAQQLEKEEKATAFDAIFTAAAARFRPILMTSVAAIFSGVPLIVGTGTGAEFRQPLGVTLVGGLCVSQLLTVFTTPAVYLFAAALKQKRSAAFRFFAKSLKKA